MAIQYVQVYLDLIHSLEPLSDAERGRLFTAMLGYAGQGTEPELRGNERFVWPQLKSQIDRNNANYENVSKVRSESGKQGGRPKANALMQKQKKQLLLTESKKSNCLQEEEEEEEEEEYEDKEEDKSKAPTPIKTKRSSASRFTPPTLEEIMSYCKKRNNSVNPNRWLAYYDSNNWRVGRNPMKDWKAAVRTWETNDFGNAAPIKTNTVNKVYEDDSEGWPDPNG